MNTIIQAFDSRAMPLLEPSTAPIAFSLWPWLTRRVRRSAHTKSAARNDAKAVPPSIDADDARARHTPR